jgi:predicted secreted Zn-dependent protease
MKKTMAVVFFFLLVSSPAWADITKNTVTKDYEVSVGPDQTLLDALNAASPLQAGGRTVHGRTEWDVKWDLEWKEDKGGYCTISKVNITLTLKTTLPKLTGTGNPDQQARFTPYLSALTQYIKNQYNFGIDAANAIDKKLPEMRAMTSCSAMKAAADAMARQIVQEYRDKESKLDSDTGFGSTRGVRLGMGKVRNLPAPTE